VFVDEFGTPSFQVHKKLLEAEILLFEGLNLKDVPPGKYVFIGLPLRLKGMDGSPVRALLLEF
jgi:arylformamidase